MATWEMFSTNTTEVPENVIPTYICQVEDSIREWENDLLVTQKQLLAAKAILKALEAI